MLSVTTWKPNGQKYCGGDAAQNGGRPRQRGPLSGHRELAGSPSRASLSPIASCAVSAAAQEPNQTSHKHPRLPQRCTPPSGTGPRRMLLSSGAPCDKWGLGGTSSLSLLTYSWPSALCSLPRGFGTRELVHRPAFSPSHSLVGVFAISCLNLATASKPFSWWLPRFP